MDANIHEVHNKTICSLRAPFVSREEAVENLCLQGLALELNSLRKMTDGFQIAPRFRPNARVVVFEGDCCEMLRGIPAGAIQLVVTSPPYNLGKEYESRLHLNEYLSQQRKVITECVRVLREGGSICWQVGNYVDNGEIIPLDSLLYPIFADLGLRMRNRIIWHFEQESNSRN